MSKQTHLTAWMGILLALFVFSALPVAAQASGPATTSAQSSFQCTYVVRPGDNLYRIGLRFGVSPLALAYANHLANINYVFAGMTLRVPCANPPPQPPPPQPPPGNLCTYVVQRGDWLATIAARFGTTWQALAALNHLVNPSVIYPGMRLAVPCAPSPVRRITITVPLAGQAICSPVNVAGNVTVSPFEATLAGRVYNGSGMLIGSGPIHVNAEMGKPGNFGGELTFDRTRAFGVGHIELAELSARDGSVIVSSSVPVRFACP